MCMDTITRKERSMVLKRGEEKTEGGEAIWGREEEESLE